FKAGKRFQNFGYYAGSEHAWNYGGYPIRQGASWGAYGMFNNFYGAGVGGGYSWPYYNDRLTRGGPLAIQPSRWAVNLNSNSDTRRLASIRLHAEYAHSASCASSWYILPGTDIRPATNIHVTVGPSLGRDYITDQYVHSVTDALPSNTYGKRYV